MKMGEGPIVVPWDFTEKSKNALLHAISVARKLEKDEIALLHFVRQNMQRDEVMQELEKSAGSFAEKQQVQIRPYIRIGSVSSGIGHFAGDVDAEMVVMGTKGIRGMQRLTGSHALKIVEHAHVPFFIVRQPPQNDHFSRVVFPVQYKTETKEKMNLVNYLHKRVNPSFYVFKPHYGDEGLVRKAQANLGFCRQFMDQREISYQMGASEGEKGFTQELLEYAHQVNAGLILLVATKNITFVDYMTGAHEQQVISNDYGIPVLIQRPAKGLTKFTTFG
jgi:nucleotide-binding universal stress UspA family protein